MRAIRYKKDTIIELKEIIYKYPRIFMDINKSTPEEDTHYATDFTIKTSNRDIAIRVRDPEKKGRRFRDLTIRTKTKWNRKTEIDKIKEGYGDIYLYCWKDKNYKIKDYMIMDIHELRSSKLLEKKRKPIPNVDSAGNKDGTEFVPISIGELNEFDCILVNKIDGYKYQKQLSLFGKIGIFLSYLFLGGDKIFAKRGITMLKEIFIKILDLTGIVSLILIIIFWLKLSRLGKRVDSIDKRIEQLKWKEALRYGRTKAKPLEKEFKYYIENQNKLVKRYNNKCIVIKNKKVIGVYDSEAEAVQETSKNEPLGTFLVQKCTLGKKDYTIILHSNSKSLKKELKKQSKENAKLNLEICEEFKYVDGEILLEKKRKEGENE